jgi:hypothetical protein
MKSVLAGVLIFGLTAAAAPAATMKLVITGFVSEQQDAGDIVWSGLASVGAAFTATYLINTRAGIAQTFTDSSTGQVNRNLLGGAAYGTSIVESAVLTIGGISRTIAGAWDSTATIIGAGNTAPDNTYGATGFLRHTSTDEVSDATSGTSAGMQFDIADILGNAFDIPADFDVPYDVTSADAVISGFAGFQSYHDYTCIGFKCFVTNDYFSYTNFTGTRAVLTNLSPEATVPLPASFGLLLAGIGALGAVSRRRHRA